MPYKTRAVRWLYCLRPVTIVTPIPLGLCRKKCSVGEKPGGIPLKNPYCLSVASLRILGISHGFSAFGGFGPRLFVTFVAMTKVKPRFRNPLCSLSPLWFNKSTPP
jgi:hypothetical protein